MRHHEFSCCVMAWALPHGPSGKRWIDVLWPRAELPSPDHAPGGGVSSIFKVNMRVGFLGRCLKTVRVGGCMILSHGPSNRESNDGGRSSSHLFPSPGNESFWKSFYGDPSSLWVGNRLGSSHDQFLKAHMSIVRLKLQWLCSFCLGRHMYTQQEDTWREHLQCEKQRGWWLLGQPTMDSGSGKVKNPLCICMEPGRGQGTLEMAATQGCLLWLAVGQGYLYGSVITE